MAKFVNKHDLPPASLIEARPTTGSLGQFLTPRAASNATTERHLLVGVWCFTKILLLSPELVAPGALADGAVTFFVNPHMVVLGRRLLCRCINLVFIHLGQLG
jgi:hypothetical protein